MCGSTKLSYHFQDILDTAGGQTIEYFEHKEIIFLKSDMKKVKLIHIPFLFNISLFSRGKDGNFVKKLELSLRQ